MKREDTEESGDDLQPTDAAAALLASRARTRDQRGAVPVRLAEAEELLSQAQSARQVARELMRRHGLSRSQANRYVRAVYLRWQGEASKVDREQKRTHIRETAWTAIRAALERQAMALDKGGGEHYYASPDVGGAAKWAELLCRLDGLLEQPDNGGGEISVNLIQVLQQHYGMTPDAVEAAQALRVGRPALADGDGGDGEG